MSRFLFTVWPFSGHVHPCLAVAAVLRERGHTVGFYTGSAYRRQIEQQGFAWFPFVNVARKLRRFVDLPDGEDTPEIYSLLSRRYTGVGIANPVRRSNTKNLMFREMIAGTLSEQASDLQAVCTRWAPDAVITDAMFWSPVVIAHEVLQVPVGVFCFFAGCMIPGPGIAPFGLGFPRPHNWHTRAVNNIARIAAKVMFTGLRREINTVRAQYGLGAMAGTVHEVSGRMPLYLVTSTPEFDGQRTDLPPAVQYVGPCLWDGAAAAQSPEWLEALRRDSPVIYVSEGTAQVQDPVLLRYAMEAFRSEPVQVVLTTGTLRDPRDLGPLPPNIRAEKFIPHSVLLPRTDVVVTNGGSSSVRDALLLGIPLVVAPMEWDQLENAQRVADSGAGIRMDVKKCSPAALREAVDTVLRDESYRRNAERIAGSFARAGQAARAAELVEQLASNSFRELAVNRS